MTSQKKKLFQNEDVVQREWRFGMHLPTGPNGEDFHLVKEVVTTNSGDKHQNMRVIPNFKRPLWTAKPEFRGYSDKKEYEKEERLDCHMVTQSQMRNKVAALTGKATSNLQLSELLTSPYVYGGDIPSTTILHRELYQKPNEGKTPTPYKVGAFDTETDVLNGTGQIIIASMTIWPYVHLIIREDWLNYKASDFDDRLNEVMSEKLDPVLANFFESMDKKDKKGRSNGHLFPDRQLKFTYEIVPDEITLIEKSFQWFHQRMPDWMAIWNIDFDVTKILDACKRLKLDPTHVLSDPRIPPEYRYCKYKRAQTNKVAASGKGKPVSPHDQWNFMHLTASFVLVDGMSAYRLLRLGEQEERSYGLDAILHKEFNGALGKLKHAPADKYVKEKWHQAMQRDYKLEYLAYAAMDTISMCLLDLKTRDLSHRLPAMADITDFSQCNSQPKRLRDAFYVFAKEDHQSIIGSVGYTRDYVKPVEKDVDLGDLEDEDGFTDEDEIEETPVVLGRKGWVITLASHMSAIGLRVIKGCKDIYTGLRAFVYDSDAVSSYPSCTQVGNVSKVTTRKEICSVDGKEEKVMRMQNLNLMFSPTNSVEYTTKMFDAYTLREILDLYDIEQAKK